MSENTEDNIKNEKKIDISEECLQPQVTSSVTEAPRLVNKGKRSMNDNSNQSCIKKKKKTRRGRNKRKNRCLNTKRPRQYKKLKKSDLNRVNNVRAQIVEMGHKLVPYNTNQFLMEEHMPEPQPMLSVQFRSPRIPRSRDSGFIVDSEENYVFSQTDEDEFLDREFSNAYETAQCERLGAMPRNQLIEEYLIMESRVDQLTKTLRHKRVPDYYGNKTILEKIQEQTEKIRNLLAENEELRQENAFLSEKLRRRSSSSCSSLTSTTSDDEQSLEDDLNYPTQSFIPLEATFASPISP